MAESSLSLSEITKSVIWSGDRRSHPDEGRVPPTCLGAGLQKPGSPWCDARGETNALGTAFPARIAAKLDFTTPLEPAVAILLAHTIDKILVNLTTLGLVRAVSDGTGLRPWRIAPSSRAFIRPTGFYATARLSILACAVGPLAERFGGEEPPPWTSW